MSRAPSPARLVVGYGAIACAMPYLALKVIWIFGGRLGASDPNIMRDGSMIALNAITAFMDLVGIGLALAFTHAWGLRIPAWLLLPPMWVATGLLSKFVIWVPITAAMSAWTSGPAPRAAAGGPVEPWVYVLVYVAFAGLGIGLILAFILYAKTRWAELFQAATDAVPRGSTHALQLPLANTAALLAIAGAALQLAWAFGIPVGLSSEAAGQRTLNGALLSATDAAMMTCAAAGVLMMVHRLAPNRPFWAPLALTWVGSGSMFGWGLWPLINVLGNTALLRNAPRTPIVNLAQLLSLLLGLTMGLLLLMIVSERHAERGREAGR